MGGGVVVARAVTGDAAMKASWYSAAAREAGLGARCKGSDGKCCRERGWAGCKGSGAGMVQNSGVVVRGWCKWWEVVIYYYIIYNH
jgi:hypothetical protein